MHYSADFARFVCFSEERVGAGDIVKNGGFLGVHKQGAARPFEDARPFAEFVKSVGPQINGAHIVGVKLQAPFRRSQRISTCLAGFFLAAQCAEAASPHGVSLVVVVERFGQAARSVGFRRFRVQLNSTAAGRDGLSQIVFTGFKPHVQ